MGTAVWWAGNGVVLVVVLPLVGALAIRVIRALRTVEGAAADIRTSLQSVASGVPPAMTALNAIASRCERLTERARVRA